MSLALRFWKLKQRRISGNLQGSPSSPIELEQVGVLYPLGPSFTTQPQPLVSSSSVVAPGIHPEFRTVEVFQPSSSVDRCTEPSVIPLVGSLTSTQNSLVDTSIAERIDTSISRTENNFSVHVQPFSSPRNIQMQVANQTVEVKAHNNIVARLLARETLSLPSIEVDEFEDEEAELSKTKLF